MTKKTWKDRLVKEQKKLSEKVDELTSFIEGSHGEFHKLIEWDQDLLMTQHATMMTYLNILTMRMKVLGLIKCEQCEDKKKALGELVNMLTKAANSTKDDEEDGRNS